jgi:hypothetical protein
MSAPRGGRWGVLAALAAVSLFYVGPALLPGRVLIPLDLLRDTGAWKPDPTVRVPVSNRLLSDVVLQFVPWDRQVRRRLEASHMPWTNPYAGRAQPLWANPQTALLSPFTWPRLLFGLAGWALSVLLKLLAIGAGGCWLARELGATPGEATVSGIFLLASGASILWALHPHTNVLAFLPALAASLLHLLSRPSRRSAAATALLAAGATAGGHPETLMLGMIGIAVLAIWSIAPLCRGERPSRRTAGAAVAACLGGFLLVGAILVPFAFLLGPSEIAAARQSAPAGGTRLWAMAAQILPGMLGSPLKSEIDLTGAFPGSENFNARATAYVGAIFLFLVPLVWRNLAPPFRRCLIVAGAALILSWRLPGIAALPRAIALLRLAAPEWWAIVAALFAGVAAGPVLFAAGRLPKRPLLGALLGAAGFVLILAGALPLLDATQPVIRRAFEHAVAHLKSTGLLQLSKSAYEARYAAYLRELRATALHRSLATGVCWAAAGLLLAGRRGRRWLFVPAAAELLLFGAGYFPIIRASAILGTPPAVAGLKLRFPKNDWSLAAAPDLYPANLATLGAVHDAASFDVLESRKDFAALERCGYQPSLKGFAAPETVEARSCLRALGVRFFLSREAIAGSSRVAGDPPPGVGAYDLGIVPMEPTDRNDPPRGFGVGLVISLAGALLALLSAALAGPVPKTRR